MSGERLTLTVPEAAKMLGLGKNSLYELVRSGELPFPILRLGRRILVPREPFLKALGTSHERDTLLDDDC